MQLGRGEGRRCHLGDQHLGGGGRVSRRPGGGVGTVLVFQWATRGVRLW